MVNTHAPSSPTTPSNRGAAAGMDFSTALAAFQKGDGKQAMAICQQLVASNPNAFDPVHLLGVLAYQAADYAQASTLLQRAIALKPNSSQASNNLALVCHAQGQYDEAIAWFAKAIAQDPHHAQAFCNRSLSLFEQRHYQQAVADCETAIALQPDFAAAYSNRANALLRLNRHAEAISDLERAIWLAPDFAAAHYNLGVAHHEMQATEKSLFHYGRALQLAPDNALAYWNVALLSLLMGDYPVGWELHEWRFRQKAYLRKRRSFSQPLWLGDSAIDGKTILLHAEQGLGDTLQFCRYGALFQGLGARVVLEVQRPLVELLGCLPGDVTVVAAGDALPHFDLHCPLMSLPLAFKTRLSDIPLPQGYLHADPVKSEYWRQRLAMHGKRKRVGLVWSGGFRENQPEIWNINERRNVAVDLIAQLNGPELLFVSLQKGNPAEAELAARQSTLWPTDNFLNVTADLHNFADTAALVDNLDLVISVDTSTAHLAAAMGKPVWLLNRYDTCWRWLLQGEQSPWYASVRIYRQPRFGDWASVMERVQHDLLQPKL